MAKKVVFLDVDGTLTLPTGEVSAKVQHAIQSARKNGHYVFLCTGRNRSGVRTIFPIGFDGVICSAGGYIEIDGEKIYESFLCEDDLNKAIEVFEKNHVMYNLEATHMTFQDDEMNKEFAKHHVSTEKLNSEMIRMMNEQKDMFNIHLMEEYINNPVPIHKICFMARDEKDLEEPRQVLSDCYNFIVHDLFSKDTINGEIIIKGTNKGCAVEYIVNKLGLSIDDTIGFGDSMNDYEMIKVCHEGIVMENGSNELKQHATRICESVENDGVYHEFVRLGLCEEVS